MTRGSPLNQCPDKCSGRDSSNQRPLTEDQEGRLSDSARLAIAKASGPPYICTHCGCVYVRGVLCDQQLGILDGVAGPGWHSKDYP